MVVQLDVYLVISLPLYHSSQTFKFINTSLFEKRAFVLKSQTTLNELELDSIDVMCPLIICKYLNHPNHCESLSLSFLFSFYNIKNNKISKCCKPKIIKIVNYNKHTNIEFSSKEQPLLYSPFKFSKRLQLRINVTWHDAYCQLQGENFQIQKK
jgi:hypothetical protein